MKWLAFFLFIILAVFILIPDYSIAHIFAQGDHGRDLYCFWRTSLGEIPYQDYWWVYGPLMPYYYGLFLKILGISLKSVLIARAVFLLGSAIFITLSLSLLATPLLALLGGLWFLVYGPHFQHTYNHDGGILLILITVYAFLKYSKGFNIRHFYLGLESVFLLSLVKINIGLSTLLVFVLFCLVADRVLRTQSQNTSRHQIYFAFIIVLFAIFFVYWAFTKDLPYYTLRQCFPYLAVDRPADVSGVFTSIRNLVLFTLSHCRRFPLRGMLGLVYFLSYILAVYTLIKEKSNWAEKKKLWLVFFFLCTLSLLNLHEYLASAIVYRLIWSFCLWHLLFFLSLHIIFRHYPNVIKYIFLSLLILIAGEQLHRKYQDMSFIQKHIPQLPSQRINAWIVNPPMWLNTVQEATFYLKEHLKKNELFLALPYDALYYFLTGKKSPVREIIFVKQTNIPECQEREIIARLEKQRINYILLSTWAFTDKDGSGLLGKTHGRLLATYIKENFRHIASFGDTTTPAGWVWPHGVFILKRAQSG